MAEVTSPAPVREPMVERSPLTPTATWVRWLGELSGALAGALADLALLQAQAAQTTTRTVAVSGAGVLTFPDMAPAGALVIGVTWRVQTTFSDVEGLLVGDSVYADRWGMATAAVAGVTGGSAAWRGAGGFSVSAPYVVLAQPLAAGFGGVGALTCACTWWPVLVPPA